MIEPQHVINILELSHSSARTIVSFQSFIFDRFILREVGGLGYTLDKSLVHRRADKQPQADIHAYDQLT